MRNLLHIIDSLGLGGAEQLLVDCINNLPEYRHHVIILNGPEELKGELAGYVHFLNLQIPGRLQLFKHVIQVRRYIRKEKIDLVHAHLYFSSILARLAVPSSIPLINTLHTVSSMDNYCKNKLSLYLDRLTYRKRHHIIAVSKQVLIDYKRWVNVKGPATVLYNFINDAYFKGCVKQSFSHPFKLVAVGNLKEVKNYPFLLEAFRNMPPDITLDIYGEGPARVELEKKIQAYRLPIRLMGAQKDLHNILPDYDAFVMCSTYEGQPLALMQAIACGLPAIVSDIPMLRELAGDYAVYFSLQDPMDVVQKIEAIVNGQIPVLDYVKPAFERVSRFARKEIYLSRLRHLYKSKLEHSPETGFEYAVV